MSTIESKLTSVPISFSANNVLQLLAALACFLAALVLPANFPELDGPPKIFLLALGGVFLALIGLSVMLRPWLTRIAQKVGFRSRMLLPREGIIYLGMMLVIAIAALTGGNPDTGNMLLLIFGMMAGPFVFNGWVVMGMLSRVHVSRHLPVSVAADTYFSVEIRLKNEKRLLSSRLVEVRDVIQGKKLRDEARVVFVRVAPGEQRSAHYDICIARRGLYQFGPMRLSSRFPLGIGERGHVVSTSDEVIVHPKIGRLLPAWKRREQELAETASRANGRIGLFDDEFHGIREYRSGDNPRSIHGRSSARHGHFMVKEHEQHREADLIVLLDLYSVADFPEELQELAISLAATICVEQTRQSSSGHYRIMIAGKELSNVESSGAGRFRDAALKELALCESSPKAQLASMLLSVCQGPLAPNSRFVLITPRPAAAKLLADSIAQENLRHEQQFTGRLMIVTADETTLNATLAMDSENYSVVRQTLTPDPGVSSEQIQTRSMQTSTHGSSAAPILNAGDRKLQSAFYRSVTLTTAIAGLVLCHSEGSYFPAGLTPIFAVIGWIFVDHLKWIRIPTWFANVCGLTALAFSVGEFSQGTAESKLYSGAHMLVYLTCIVLMMQKGHRQYWWLLALTLLQMAVSAVLKTGIFFGGSMLLMMAMMLWTLSVFSLYRVMDLHLSRKSKRDPMGQSADSGSRQYADLPKPRTQVSSILVRDGLQRDTSEEWIGWRFRSMVTGSFLVSLVLAGFVFAAFPRVWVPGAGAFPSDSPDRGGLMSRSGFKENVSLGHVGPILISQKRVLAFSVTSLKTRQPVSAEQFAAAIDMDEVRFRGNTLGHYRNGNWSSGVQEIGIPPSEVSRDTFPGRFAPDPEFSVEIHQDPPIGTYMFAPYPKVEVRVAGDEQMHLLPNTGAMVWIGAVPEKELRTYTVLCSRIDPTSNHSPTFHTWTLLRQASPGAIERWKRNTLYVARGTYSTPNIEENLPLLYEFSNTLCMRNGNLVSEAERVRTVMQYLGSENEFEYSTNQTRHDRSIDPVEDFVFNTKSGHCEYYASACVLMLQSVNVPARLVNGYYGSEVNLVTGKNEIRQCHAHTWVEVFLDYRWQTLDPTPAAPRREMVSRGNTASLVNSLQTVISTLWHDGIHNMSAERQKEFFAPVISTSKSIIETIRQRGLFRTVWHGLQSFLATPDAWFSWQGGVATFLLLFAGGLISRLHPWTHFGRILKSLTARFSGRQRAGQSVIRFYAQFCATCEQHGMQLPATNSALENGRSAVDRFGKQLESDELRLLPMRIATAFNAVRFGKAELTFEQAADIGKDLTLFSTALSNRQSLTT